MPKFRLRALAPSEAQTQQSILRYLAISPRVAWAQRMNTGAIKIPVPGGRDRFVRFGFPGCPDILGQLIDGRLLAVEVKSPSGRASEAQEAFLALVATHGGVAVLARSTGDLTAILGDPHADQPG
ncbi:MAG: VRR-NUC domain-containing protein [Chromatiaceae bacterium]|nr:VRR-NUC domain-containing protein [Chromatiaceae bacterium]